MAEPHLTQRFEPGLIASRVGEVATALDGEFRNRRLVLIAILKGASFFLADLARQISVSISCEYISVRRAESSEVLQIDFSTHFVLAGRPVLLLKDVVNSGVIENYLIDHVRALGASLVRLAAILDKPKERKTAVPVDFPLFAVGPGVFAGYGMEYKGRYAHLPYIAQVQEQ